MRCMMPCRNPILKFFRLKPFPKMHSLFIGISVIWIFLRFFTVFLTGIMNHKHCVSAHHFIIFSQYTDIAENLPKSKWNQHRCISPSYTCPCIVVQHGKSVIWYHGRHFPIFKLIILHITHPFFKKGGCIHQERPCTEKYLCISCPAQPFSCRAICRHVRKVALHTPQCILK